MKVSYPLSLKVSLWLVLNLLLLAGLAVGFLVMQGGLRWDALVAGPSGERMQSLANVIAGEASATSGEARNAVLDRFSSAYHAEFFLFAFDEEQLAGSTVQLPADVKTRMEPRGWAAGGFRGRRGAGRGEPESPRAEYSAPEPSPREVPVPGASTEPEASPREAMKAARGDLRARDPVEKGPLSGDAKRDPVARGVGPEGRGAGPDGPGFGPGGEPRVGRFIVRAGSPAAYWVGLRVPFYSLERSRPQPARLIVRVNSLWSLLHLLNLQSWVLGGTAVLVLSVAFWLPLVRSITHSVGQLTVATEQIAEGNFSARVQTGRRDELGKLGESVNRMATRLDAHMTGQKRFLGDVAHELCSPLARLQMATGILAERAPSNLQETVADVRDEVQQMSSLVNELLAFTKSGLRAREVTCHALEVEPLLRDVLSREDLAGRVSTALAPELRIVADADLLARALGNLVRNALRYAGEAGPIVISGQREADHVLIAVEDNGPGVPAGDLDRLGEPFFRPELARTREGGGVGLGLAIVRNSIQSCGGEVRFANRTPRGFRAELRLRAA